MSYIVGNKTVYIPTNCFVSNNWYRSVQMAFAFYSRSYRCYLVADVISRWSKVNLAGVFLENCRFGGRPCKCNPSRWRRVLRPNQNETLVTVVRTETSQHMFKTVLYTDSDKSLTVNMQLSSKIIKRSTDILKAILCHILFTGFHTTLNIYGEKGNLNRVVTLHFKIPEDEKYVSLWRWTMWYKNEK